MRLDLSERTLRLRAPFEASHGVVGERVLLAVAVTGDDGLTGYGEAAPLEGYDGVSIARVRAALERYRSVLERCERLTGADPDGHGHPDGHGRHDGHRHHDGHGRIVDACRAVDDLPQAYAAIDLALWDRAGREAGRPVAALIADGPIGAVTVNQTISARDRASAAAQAGRAVAEGFSTVKVKVGLGDDVGRVAAVRATVGGEVAIRCDANGAWDVEEAVGAIEALSALEPELVEEPTHGLRAVREVRERVTVRVAIDETAAEEGALTAGVADAVCLKISRCGGISGLIAAAALVRASGAEVYLASTLDGPLGIAAAVHAAAALTSRGPVAACGLNTLEMFEDLDNPLPAVNGQIIVPTEGGLGVEAI